MKIEQIYTGCLAEAAYYIESEGEVAIIDPLRETAQYIEKAASDNAKIKYIFETHFHADFVSGHLDLAKKTGAKIVFGPNAKTNYEMHEAKDGEEFRIGNITIKAIHTPGHTMESTTYLLVDENGVNHAIFTGDTLFLGDVGRPDLAIKSDVTKEDLAAILFTSLREKVMPLADEVIVYPGHGAGSACGKSMSKETIGTLGEQKRTNYALRADMTQEEFVKEVLSGIVPPPQYFSKNAMLNKTGYEEFENVLEKGNVSLLPEAFEAVANQEEALILDVRPQEEFAKAHIPNSIFIGLDGSFAPWVGALISDLKQPILIVAPEGREEEAVTRLSRVGYDNSLGFLDGGLEAWAETGKEIESVESIDANSFARIYEDGKTKVLDVRKESEFLSEHLIGAENFPLDFVNENMNQLNPSEKYYIHCAGGYRSMITSSILQARGIKNIVDIAGGFASIKETEAGVSAFVCPSTL